MKVTLIPTSEDGCEDLVVDSFPFVFGRTWSSLEQDGYARADIQMLLKHVSRKHATFSLEDGSVFLEDNNSLNGTYLNGRKLINSRVRLATGDVILFADRLEFFVELHDPEKPITPSPPLLDIQAEDFETTLEISRTPFFLTPETLSAGSADSKVVLNDLPTDERLKIVRQDGKAFLLTVKSQSSVSVDGRVISAGRTELHSESIIRFSGNLTCVFRLPAPPEDTVHAGGKSPNKADETLSDSTIYLDEATTFLNAFKQDPAASEPGKDTAASPSHDDADPSAIAPGRKPKTFGRYSTFIKPVVALLVAGILITGAVMLYRSTDSYKIKKLFNEKQYSACLDLADRLLADTNDADIQSIAQKSLVYEIVPEFSRYFDDRNEDQIKQLLDSYEEKSVRVKHGDVFIDLLRFMGHVHNFNGASRDMQAINDTRWKEEIASINKTWQENKDLFRPMIDEVLQIEPAFKPIAERFYSEINDNQEVQIYDISEIRALEQQILSLGRAKRFDQIEKQIRGFQQSHAGLQGCAGMLQDLERLKALTARSSDDDIFAVIGKPGTTRMQTEVFKKLADEFAGTSLPDKQTQEMIAEAKQLWSNGDIHGAIQVLGQVHAGMWHDRVQARLKELKHLASLLDQVETSTSQEDRCAAVAALYALESVVPVYKDRVKDIFQDCQEKVLLEGAGYLADAGKLYQSYTSNGGITAEMRLASTVTNSYRKRAVELASARNLARKVLSLMKPFDLELTQKEQQFIENVFDEYDLQVSRLQENRVLSPGVLREKMALLTSGNLE